MWGLMILPQVSIQASVALRALARVCLGADSSASPGAVPKQGLSKALLADLSTFCGTRSLAHWTCFCHGAHRLSPLLLWAVAGSSGDAMFTFPQTLKLGKFLQAKAIPSGSDFLKQLV